MTGDAERVRLAGTFDSAAELYERVRPEYPDELFSHLTKTARLGPGHRVLEVGSGTGKATAGLVEQSLHVTCLEPGPALSKIARRNFGPRGVEVIESTFENWEKPPSAEFALVAAATSWHWVDPSRRCQLAADVLAPGGHLAVWGAHHVIPPGGDPFFYEIQEVYDAIGEGHPKDIAMPGPSPADEDALSRELDNGPFELVDTRSFAWETRYECEQYIDLLNTFSGHIVMEGWKRQALFREIRRRLTARPRREVRRGWGATLRIARLR